MYGGSHLRSEVTVLRPDDPRKAKTLGEAALKENGNWNGARALSWLSEALSPGHGMSEEEVMEIWKSVQRERNEIKPE